MSVIYSSSIIEFIKNKTGGLLKENAKEFQFFCPFCDDAYRKPNPRWGHLYISKHEPVFFCQRCKAKGHIVKLLEYLQYPDIEKIKKLFKYTNNNFVKKLQTTITSADINKTVKLPQPIEILNSKNTIPMIYDTVSRYLYQRTLLTDKDLDLYFLRFIFDTKIKIPGILFLARNIFYPKLIQPLQIRFITNDKKFRYKKLIDKDFFPQYEYFLTNIDNYSIFKIKNAILTEGPFDAINLYNIYAKKLQNLVTIAITGSYYQKYVTKIIQYFPFLETIHVFIDQDIDCKLLIRSLRYEIKFAQLKRYAGRKITVKIYKNLLTKDYGDITSYIAPVKIKEEVFIL